MLQCNRSVFFLQQAGLLTREALSEAIKVLLTKIRRRRLAKAFHEFDDHRQSMIRGGEDDVGDEG